VLFIQFWEHCTDLTKDTYEDACVARLLAIEVADAFQKMAGHSKHQSYLHDAVEHIIHLYKEFKHPLRGSTEALEHGNSLIKSMIKFLCSYRKGTREQETHREAGGKTTVQSYSVPLVEQAANAQLCRKIINQVVPNRKSIHTRMVTRMVIDTGTKLAPTEMQKGLTADTIQSQFRLEYKQD